MRLLNSLTENLFKVKKAMNSYVIGDIHGAYKALKQCLKRSNFDIYNDQLIVLGDVCQGYHQVDKCIELLLKIPNIIFIRGNWDEKVHNILFGKFFYDQLNNDDRPLIQCYMNKNNELNETKSLRHLSLFFQKQIIYYYSNNNLFVHGGIDPHMPINMQKYKDLMNNKDLTIYALCLKKNQIQLPVSTQYKQIFIGHTSTLDFNSTVPIITNGLVNLNTGSAKGGKLTIMNIKTLDYWQSDLTQTLYPNILI